MKLHLHLQLLPIACVTTWVTLPGKSAAALDSHKSTNPNPKVTVEYSEITTKIEIKCTIDVMHLNHPEIIPHSPSPWKNCLP